MFCEILKMLFAATLDARLAGWVTYCRIGTSTMPRAQNRAEKGSIYFVKTIGFDHLVIIYLWEHPNRQVHC